MRWVDKLTRACESPSILDAEESEDAAASMLGRRKHEKRIRELNKARPKASCRLIKDFEREARMDGMAVTLLAAKKKTLVQELNSYIAQKKAISEQNESRDALLGTTAKKGAAASKGKDGKSIPCLYT